MITVVYVLATLVWLGVLVLAVWPIVRAYRLFRGARLVTCPETGQPAGVEVDAGHAALTTAFGARELRLEDCSRWPEKAGCAQDCLRQVEASPEECLVRRILARWYEGKTCVLCGTPLGDLNGLEHRAALRSPERKTLAWDEVLLENLDEVLRTHEPICWICHNAQTFRREHPDLVVDRPWNRPVERSEHPR